MSDKAVPGDRQAGELADASSDQLPVRDWWAASDPILAVLVTVVNTAHIEVSIRLATGAGVVSGDLVGVGAFFERSAKALWGAQESSGDTAPVREAIASFLDSQSEKVRGAEGLDGDIVNVRHIHLDNAMLHQPGAEPLILGLWRARLTSVEGWALGNYDSHQNGSA